MSAKRKMFVGICGPKLEPEVAAANFDRDPASVFISLPEIMRAFGLSEDELRLELTSGALVASGVSDGSGGYTGVGVRGDDLARWMAATGFQVRSGDRTHVPIGKR